MPPPPLPRNTSPEPSLVRVKDNILTNKKIYS